MYSINVLVYKKFSLKHVVTALLTFSQEYKIQPSRDFYLCTHTKTKSVIMTYIYKQRRLNWVKWPFIGTCYNNKLHVCMCGKEKFVWRWTSTVLLRILIFHMFYKTCVNKIKINKEKCLDNLRLREKVNFIQLFCEGNIVHAPYFIFAFQFYFVLRS